MTVAIALPTLKLSESERESAGLLRRNLQLVRGKNREKAKLYEAKRAAEDFGIAAPSGLPQLIAAVIGWPGTVVDVLEERLELRGWTGADLPALLDAFRDKHLDVEAGRGHLDSLIYGCGFVAVGRGADGEPDVLVTVESTESCTVTWDYRARRAASALSSAGASCWPRATIWPACPRSRSAASTW